MEPVTVKIGDIEATLRPVGITAAVSLAIGPDDPRAKDPGWVLAVSAACLRAAWPDDVAWPARRRPRALRLGQDPGQYGQEILDALYPASRMTLAALGRELAKARSWVVVSSITEHEVAEVSDFSDGLEERAG